MTFADKSFDPEKRKYPRFHVDLPIKYNRTSSTTKYGRASNASLGGMLVHLPEEIGIGHQLPVQVFFPSGSEFNMLETFVQVVWKGVHLKEDWTWDYRAGVRFVDIPPEGVTNLKNFFLGLA